MCVCVCVCVCVSIAQARGYCSVENKSNKQKSSVENMQYFSRCYLFISRPVWRSEVEEKRSMKQMCRRGVSDLLANGF